jgi:hypothetical protein
MRLQHLAEAWMQAKEDERAATERRREIEDQIRSLANIADDSEGVQNVDAGLWKVKVTCRLDRKVDSDKVQELAYENGLTDHLATLFRWKPEINMKAWDAAAPQITTALAGAITTKPGRPSFAIQPKE